MYHKWDLSLCHLNQLIFYIYCPNFSTIIFLDIDLKIYELYTCFIINFSTRINQMYRGEVKDLF